MLYDSFIFEKTSYDTFIYRGEKKRHLDARHKMRVPQCHDSFIFEKQAILTRDMSHLYVWNDSCSMSHLYVWHDSFMCVPWLFYMWKKKCVWTRDTGRVSHSAMTHSYLKKKREFLRETQYASHIHMCDMTHSCECPCHACAMTRSYRHLDARHKMRPRSVTWLIHVCAMTHSCHVCAMTRSCRHLDARHKMRPRFACVTWLIHECAMTHSCVCHDSFM